MTETLTFMVKYEGKYWKRMTTAPFSSWSIRGLHYIEIPWAEVCFLQLQGKKVDKDWRPAISAKFTEL